MNATTYKKLVVLTLLSLLSTTTYGMYNDDDLMEYQVTSNLTAVFEKLYYNTEDPISDDDIDVAECLLELGADPNASINPMLLDSPTPLIVACIIGNTRLVALLLKYNANVHSLFQNKSPAQWTCYKKPNHEQEDTNKREIIKNLIEHGALLEEIPHKYALQYTQQSDDEDTEIVINQNEDSSAENIPLQFTTIFKNLYQTHTESIETESIQTEKIDTIRLLLKKGTSPNIYLGHDGQTGPTPLIVACMEGNQELVQLLLQYNAKTNISFKNISPLTWVCYGLYLKSDHDHQMEAFNRIAIIKMLMHAGARLEERRANAVEPHEDPLYYANNAKNKYLTAFLIKKNASTKYESFGIDTNNLLRFKRDIQKPLPLALFYGTSDTSSTLDILPKKSINTIVFFYSALLNQERTRNWEPVCRFVYQEQADAALVFLPFMSKKEQFNTCQSYYLLEHKELQVTCIQKQDKKIPCSYN